MPRVKPTEMEGRRQEITFRIEDLMRRYDYDNTYMAKILGISVKTFIGRKKHHPEEFSLKEIWLMEKAFRCKLSEPLERKVITNV